jgi:hypothetical protein
MAKYHRIKKHYEKVDPELRDPLYMWELKGLIYSLGRVYEGKHCNCDSCMRWFSYMKERLIRDVAQSG